MLLHALNGFVHTQGSAPIHAPAFLSVVHRRSAMHVLMVIVGGIVLFGVFLLFGRLWGGDVAGLSLAAKIFIPVWLLVAVANMWIGVSHAGYSVREELPILLVVFIVPAALGALAIWRYSHS
jgi:hypothetical protein